jgi:hypothetical protein
MLSEKPTKNKLAIAKTFFASFHGLEISEWGKTGGMLDFGNQQEKQIFKRVARDSGRNSILNTHEENTHEEDVGISNLFQEFE